MSSALTISNKATKTSTESDLYSYYWGSASNGLGIGSNGGTLTYASYVEFKTPSVAVSNVSFSMSANSGYLFVHNPFTFCFCIRSSVSNIYLTSVGATGDSGELFYNTKTVTLTRSSLGIDLFASVVLQPSTTYYLFIWPNYLSSETHDYTNITYNSVSGYANVSNVYVNVSNSFKSGLAYVNVNGVWKSSSSIWVNVNGTWKQNS